MENGRLFRLMAKLGSVGSRPNHSGGGPNDHSYENGDRFLVRMFSNFLFRQIDENGQPWLQISHIVAALNKVSELPCIHYQNKNNSNSIIHSIFPNTILKSF